MATNLKLKKKCHIVPPEWLSVGLYNLSNKTLSMLYHFLDFLQERLARETSRPEFSKLPLRFAEIAKVILDVSANTLFVW
jgi:GINS complex subunit 2